MDHQQGLTVAPGTLFQWYVAAWMGGEFGGEWVHAQVWPSLFPVHLKLSQYCLLITPYTLIHKDKFLNFSKLSKRTE